jgi:membrane associated rhomboid family serine protease
MFILPTQEGNPPKRFPFINLLLITLNLYVFFKTATRVNFEQLILTHGFIPAHPHFQDILASMFMHAGLAHLIGNMYFLFVFGDMVEDRLGRTTYLLTYLLCGFGACYLQYTVDPKSTLPMIGASGAISGVCALYMVMFPWQKMRLQFFFLIFPIFSIGTRAFFVVGFWFLEQYLMATVTPVGMGGVAFWAHVGGFLTAILLFPFIDPGKNKRTA